eukprot:304615_1
MGNERSDAKKSPNRPVHPIDASADATISRISRLQSQRSITKSGNSATHSHSVINGNSKMRVPQSPTLRVPSIKKEETMTSLTLDNTAKPSNRRKSSILDVHNGVTGKYISVRICKIAAMFWKQHIEVLNVPQKLEIGCCIFFGMLGKDKSLKRILKRVLPNNKSVEETSLKFLDMMGWLLRQLITDKINFYDLLTKLGIYHTQMGFSLQHFDTMLDAMHETFSYYFEQKYSIQVKYSMDEIFTLSAQIMTGQNLKNALHLHDLSKQFQGKDIPFLANLDACLKCTIGKEYLYRYLAQTWCDEMVIFEQSMRRFKQAMSDKERFMIARDITKTCIKPTASFALNLSYEHRINAMSSMTELEG